MRLRVLSSLACLALPIALTPILLAQQAKQSFYLHDGDTVVFYGDSITEQRYYSQAVEDYVITRYPHMRVQFFNAGNGGDRVTGGSAGPIDDRLTRDVFPLKPTVVTIMLGMNDGGYGLLTPAIESKYTQGYEHILDSLQKTLPGVRITLLGPSPYDEVSRPAIVSGGYNSTLTHFGEIDTDLAQKHNATFIDLNAPFVASIKRGVAINPMATELLLPDRVHPEPTAHWFIAEAILKGWNAPSIVSSTTIDAKSLKVIDSQNSQITDIAPIAGHSASIGWTELDGALPLPLDEKNVANHFLRQISDIDKDLDQQPLAVQGLPPGNYQLTIDGQPTGIFTSDELAHGVNLADMSTPMRGQSYRVSWFIRDREDAHYVRLRMLVNQMRTGTPAEPGATNLLHFEEDLQKQIYDMAQPLPHKYQIAPTQSPR
jgi:lysophospholipase L1-like esterase